MMALSPLFALFASTGTNSHSILNQAVRSQMAERHLGVTHYGRDQRVP